MIRPKKQAIAARIVTTANATNTGPNDPLDWDDIPVLIECGYTTIGGESPEPTKDSVEEDEYEDGKLEEAITKYERSNTDDMDMFCTWISYEAKFDRQSLKSYNIKRREE